MDAPLAALKIKRITHDTRAVTGGEERERGIDREERDFSRSGDGIT
jgi:hypothetical protein